MRTTPSVLGLPALVLFASVSCGPGSGLPKLPDLPAGCPNLVSAVDIAKVDFAAEFKIAADPAHKMKAGIAAAAELRAFAESIDADLREGCGGLAKDLGAGGSFADGKAACEAAIKAMNNVRAKMGASAHVTLSAQPPHCTASMEVMTDCAAECDATVKPGTVKAECEAGKLSGQCDAECSGSCDLSSAGAFCEGTCEGSCEASFKGTCGGECNGKCNGKDTKGACSGTCEGKCESHANGECKGKCGGRCELKGKAKCTGTCNGSCSVQMKAPKCTGEVTPPKMSAECKAHCDAKMEGKVECHPASVAVRIEGAADAKVADNYRAALEKNLPIILKIAVGMAHRAEKAAGSVRAVVEGLQGSVEAVAKTSSDKTAGAKLVACVASPFKGALDAAASVKANVKVSVDVKASASASGSASGKTG